MERGKPGLRSKKLAILSRSLIICSSSTNEEASSPEERNEGYYRDPPEGSVGNSEKFITRSVSVQTPVQVSQRAQEGPKRAMRRSFSIKVRDDITAAAAGVLLLKSFIVFLILSANCLFAKFCEVLKKLR